MKLKEILSTACFICLAFSCSMENDTIMNDMDKEIDAATNTYASVQFSLSSGAGLSTKATSDVSGPENDTDYSEMEENEMAVNDCFVFVAYNNLIIGRRHYSKEEITPVKKGTIPTYELNKDILFKVPSGNPELQVYAVGMLKDSNDAFTDIFNSVTKLDELKSSTISNLSDFIKVGEGTVKHYDNDNTNGYQTSDKTKNFGTDGTVQSGKATITLTHRAAAIEVAAVNANNSKGQPVTVTVTKIQVENQILNASLNGGMAGTIKTGTTSYPADTQLQESGPVGYRFYTYENGSTEKKTTMTITYQMNGQEHNYSFPIKTFSDGETSETILANHLYRITLNITSNVADVQIACYTMNWIEHELSGSMK